MNWQERKAKIQRLNVRDKLIVELANSISNNLLMASQNRHSERIQAKYELAAQTALADLENLLMADVAVPEHP